MCNNSPAEATSPENGWRSSVELIHSREVNLQCKYGHTSKRAAAIASKGWTCVHLELLAVADLGGSSKYSSEILEDRCGEGFHVNSS